MNEIAAQDEVKSFLRRFVWSFQEYFGESLVGIYLHGSLAMGCFNPVSSDIDLLIVVKETLDLNAKHGISKILLELSETAPAKGPEMSIVTLNCVQDFHYPTPYELHFSYSNKNDFA